MSCADSRAWYERPSQLLRRAGVVVGVQPAQLVKLCPAHVRTGDRLVRPVAGGGITCGFSMRLPPSRGVRIVEARRKRGVR